MSNIASYLSKREIGSNNKKWNTKDKVQDYFDEIGSKPVINKACSLSRRCRATFLVDFSSDRTKIASTHGDHSVRITDVATGKCTHVLEGHPRTPWCLAFHPSSNQIVASGCLDGEVRIWDLFGGGSEVWRCKEHTVIASLTFHPTNNLLVFAAGNSVYFWDWAKPEPFACCSTKHDFERVRWVKFHPHGHHLYTGITNTATLQQSNSSRVSFISGRPSSLSQRARGLSNVYDNLVECFQTYQRDRVINLATAGSGPVGNTADLDTPPSPVHEEGLSFARQYARHVTETAASEAAEQDVIPSEDQGPSSSTVPSILSEDLSWSPPPRTAPPEEATDNLSSARPVIIVTNSHERPPRPLNSSRISAGIIGNRRTDNLYRHMFRQNNNDSASGSLTNIRRSPLSRPRSILDHSNCDGHCDVCRNYNLTVHNRRNQSSLQSRQERLESRRRYCRDRLMALRRRQNDLPTCSFNERLSIYSDNSSERLSGHNQQPFSLSSSSDQPEASASGQSSVDRSVNISENANSTSSLTENIRNNFVSITTRLEQEMNELDRRINDLRNSFQESIRQLQVRRGIGEASDEHSLNRDRDVPLNQQVTRPVITVTGCRESHDTEQNHTGNQQTRDRTHLLETALRTSVSSPRQSLPTPPVVSSNQSSRTAVSSSNTWQTLQRHHLHPHYSVSILDDTINRPHDAVQRAINHTIAGAFMGRGEAAVASNIVNQTYRIQYWDMISNAVPDISDGPNAISVSISPRNQHVLVGLAAKRLIWVFTTNQLVGQIYKLDNANTGENSTKHVMDIMHPCDIDIRSHVSVNSARWMPTPGHGIVYGTNRGDLQICRPGSLKVSEDEEGASTSSSISRRNILLDHMLGGISRTPVTVNSIATQTPAVRRSMSTQTDESDSNVIV
ncbi:Activating molecule in BECN1-regulated autophagy protein 1 [Mytilus coruscus]|uniref:Activating molecule in BECN1-regulated autophagy protein 1 n=1 Tax=Mytilus coruscus TaxID=42192 RepID=A0A6J8C574_MYTCO|nr:Activating molecule in BECN1-regulated autophagy protein 1 [Mytilus coruscus]